MVAPVLLLYAASILIVRQVERSKRRRKETAES
jgi:hypothetical protein